MSELTAYIDFRQRFFQFYFQKEYQQALDLLNREGGRFPDEAPAVLGWTAAMMALTGDSAGAIRQIGAALDAGYWYDEEALRSDSDFAALVGNPEFEAVVERSREARLKVAGEIKPALTLIEPVGSPRPWPLLIALHGNNNNARRTAPLWECAAAMGWLVAVPQSSQAGWATDAYVWNDVDRAVVEAQEHYRTLNEQGMFDPARVVLGGFSMGARVAVRAALTGEIPSRGFIPVEAWIPEFDVVTPWLESGGNPAVRGYIIAGEQNKEYHETAITLYEAIRAKGLACEHLAASNVGHGFPPDFPDVLRRALDFVCAG